MNIQQLMSLCLLLCINFAVQAQNSHSLPLLHHLQVQNTNKLEGEVDRLNVRMQRIVKVKTMYRPLAEKAQKINTQFVPLKTAIDELQTELLASSSGIYRSHLY